MQHGAGKIQIQPTIHKVWDVVIGTRQCPIVPRELRNAEGTVITNQATINAAEQRVQTYYEAFNKAANIIT